MLKPEMEQCPHTNVPVQVLSFDLVSYGNKWDFAVKNFWSVLYSNRYEVKKVHSLK